MDRKDIGRVEMIQTLLPDAVCISAKTGLRLDKLAEVIRDKYKGAELLLRFQSSQANGKIQSFLRAHGRIVSEEYTDNIVTIEARLGKNQLPELNRLGVTDFEIVSG